MGAKNSEAVKDISIGPISTGIRLASSCPEGSGKTITSTRFSTLVITVPT